MNSKGEANNRKAIVRVENLTDSTGVVTGSKDSGRMVKILDLPETAEPGMLAVGEVVSDGDENWTVRFLKKAAAEDCLAGDYFVVNLENTINGASEMYRNIENSNHNEIERIKQDNDNTVSRLNSAYADDVRDIESQRAKKIKSVTGCQSNFNREKAVIANAKGAAGQNGLLGNAQVASDFDSLDQKSADIDQSFQEIKSLYNTFYDERLAERKDSHEQERSDQEKTFQSALSDCRLTGEQHIDSLLKRLESDLQANFNGEVTGHFSKAARASRFRTLGYKSPDALPDSIYIGEEVLDLSDTAVPIVKEKAVQELADNTDPAANTIQVPYVFLPDGKCAILVEHDQSTQKEARRQISLILENLFYSYPGGQLEATLIDPLNAGASFVNVLKFGTRPETRRLINTKAWSSTADIKTALKGIEGTIANNIQNYGSSYRSRLEREPSMALAITDFPEHFDKECLQILRTVVEKADDGGLIILIDADKKQLDELVKTSSDAENIVSRLQAFEMKDGKLVFQNSAGRSYLKPDVLADIDDETRRKMVEEVERHSRFWPDPIEFKEMYNFDVFEPNNWFKGSRDELTVPLGIRGEDRVVSLQVGRNGTVEHHAMIAGTTGAGKSTCLHTMITSALINYSPEDLQMYLLDFKEGVEFKLYTQYRLPNFRTVSINSIPEFGLTVLRDLCKEIGKRSTIYQRKNASDLDEYNQACIDEGHPEERLPRILLIIDEVNELFNMSDSLRPEVIQRLTSLTSQGRALGIFVVLACQDFNNCPGISGFSSNMAVRLAIRGTSEGYSSVLNANNDGGLTLINRPAGTAIYNTNGGVESANIFFRIARMEDDFHFGLLKKLDEYYRNPLIADRYKGYRTKVLTKQAQDSIDTPFSRVLQNEISPADRKNKNISLYLGLRLSNSEVFSPALNDGDKENLLMISPNKAKAEAVFTQILMSLQAYGAIHPDRFPDAVVADLGGRGDDSNDSDSFLHQVETNLKTAIQILEDADPAGSIRHVDNSGLVGVIDDIYDLVIDRADGRVENTHPVYFMIFGLDRARVLNSSMYGQSDSVDKLQTILKEGPKNGVHSVVWSSSYPGAAKILGPNFENAYFNARLLSEAGNDVISQLAFSALTEPLGSEAALYSHIYDDEDRQFRPYAIPDQKWLKDFAEAVNDMAESED